MGAVVSGVSTRIDQPSLARVSDALLGGCDHYGADRAAVRRLLAIAPGAAETAREHRAWLVRVVRFLADERGIDQFLDLGSGLPTLVNTHQVAQRHNPAARVVYVDNDPVVQVHGRAVLEENDHTHVSGADLTDPGATFGDPVVYRHLDFDRPVAVLLCGILHHVDTLDRARHLASAYAAELCPGSYLALTHHCAPPDDPHRQSLAARLDATFACTPLATVHRTPGEITSLFDGLDLVPPGLRPLHEWWPDGPRLTPLGDLDFLTLGGVGVKP